MSEATPRFRVEPLGSQHDRADFSCGVPVLDQYLQRQASQDRRRNAAAVFVLVDGDSETLAGYYTLSGASVEPASLPVEVARRLPRYDALPATLLGRLAVDQRYRGTGLGKTLLLHALRRALDVNNEIAATVVLVDAKDDAARSFYEAHDFSRLLDQPYRLFLPLLAIARLFPQAQR